MASNRLHLIVTLLSFSHLLLLNAVPLSRSKDLLHRSQVDQAIEATYQIMTDESFEEELLNERMLLEINDYPPTGPNIRHTPPPQH